MNPVRLDQFQNSDFERGAPRWCEMLWLIADAFAMSSWFPGSGWRVALLRLFGAKIGDGVVIKPRVQVKFPWRLVVGDHVWIGERAWIDNLATVTIGNHVALSQGVYLCTGSHDWSRPGFDLITRPITIGDGAWIAAKSVLGPGTVVGEGAVVGLGCVATGSLEPWGVYSGAPAKMIRKRVVAG